MVGQVLVIALFKAFQIAHSETISGSGDYIIPNTCYELSCSYETFKNVRITLYNILNESNAGLASYTVKYVNTSGNCIYRNPEWTHCSAGVCSCDGDGMATHFCYNHTSDVTGNLTIVCFDETSSSMRIPVAEGPGSSLRFNPPDQSVTKIKRQQFSVICLAECVPSCQFKWMKGSSVVRSGSTLQIPELSKEDNGTYTCRAENKYGTPRMMSLYLTVNYGPEYITLSPADKQYNVTEGKKIPAIHCMSDCRPACNYNWIGPNVPAGTMNVLNLTNIQKNQRGVFNCMAYNDVGNLTSYDVRVNVQFGPGSSLQLEPSITSVSKIKGAQLGPVNCSAICSPPCQYKWTKANKTISVVSQLLIQSLSIADHGQFICTASNDHGSQNKSIDVKVDYGPQSVNLIPNYTHYTVTEGTNISPINCTSDCRPTCIYKWYGPNVPNGTTNVLRLQNIKKNQSGVYNCTAYNYVDNLKTSDVNVDVEFGPGSSLQFNPNTTSVTKNKGDKLEAIECIALCNPPCEYKWTKPDGKVSIDRVLTITFVEITDHGSFVCTAYNGRGDGQNKSLYLNVNYGPMEVILSPSTNQYTVIHGHNMSAINCTAECRPECKYMWFGPHVPSNTFNVLSLHNIQKNQRGDFNCTATNKVGSMQSSVVHVNVQYEPFVNNVSVNGSNFTVSENTTVTLSCKIDGNPKPQNTWKKNSIILNEAPEYNGFSFYTIQQALCKDNGNYSCVANNSLGIASAQQSLYVTCSPRLNLHVEQPKTKIGLPKGSDLSLTVQLLAYPTPEFPVWIFKDTRGNESIISANLKTYELYKHVVVLSKTNLTLYDFGDYILKVNNTIGSASQTYHVVPQGPPDPTSILNVTCGVQTAVLYWRISFNGGETQNFSIIINKNGNEIHIYQSGISDEDDEQIKYARIKLSAGKYLFMVNGKNKYGNSNSTDSMMCQVKEVTRTNGDSVVGAAAGGGTAAIVVILAIVLLLFIKNRRSPKGDDGRRNLTTEDRDDDDGLKENPLYISSGETANNSGSLYSIVNKTGKTDKAEKTGNLDQGPVYSEVKKKDAKGKITTGKKNIKKTEKSGKAGKDMEMGSVYENSQNLRKNVDNDDVYANTVKNATTDKIYRPTKNKDGLIYADLDLAPCVGGNRFVIRGLENRSNYAIIDLTKTAEPLPSDDDEDEQKSDKTIQDKSADGE